MNYKRIILYICRFLVGCTLMLSGFVKAVDPLGTQYKIADYARVAGFGQGLTDTLALAASIALSAMEFTLGTMILLAIWKRFSTRLVVLFLSFMTVISLCLVIFNPISDCGCFGDAVKLTNGQTFLKNLVLLAASIYLALHCADMKTLLERKSQWIATHFTLLFSLSISLYALYALPLFDYRPYYVGQNIDSAMQIPEGKEAPQYETTFIMEKDGETQEFSLENYPDSTWTFVDRETRLVKKGYVPPIHDFVVLDQGTGEEITEILLQDSQYAFLLIAPHLEKTDNLHFGDINRIARFANQHGYAFTCLTASSDEQIEIWKKQTGAEYGFANADETTLKTMIRSNPGLILIKNGTILHKWSKNMLPSAAKLNAPLEKTSLGTQATNRTMTKVCILMLLFFIPMLLLLCMDQGKQLKRFIKTT